MKKVLIAAASIILLLTLTFTAVSASSLPFTDVPDGKWYSEAVQYVYENGLMNGTSSTTFDPSGKLTRAMLVTVLYRAAGQPAVEFTPKFSDVPAGVYDLDVLFADGSATVKVTVNPKTVSPPTGDRLPLAFLAAVALVLPALIAGTARRGKADD